MDDTLIDQFDDDEGDEEVVPRRRLRRRGAHGPSRRTRRKRWAYVLAGGGAVLVVYYALVIGSLKLHDTSNVKLDGSAAGNPTDRVTLQIEAVGLDTSTGSFDCGCSRCPGATSPSPRAASWSSRSRSS